MKLTKELQEKILHDNRFSLEMSAIIGKRQASILAIFRRNPEHPLFQTPEMILFYKGKGFSLERIFTNFDPYQPMLEKNNVVNP